MTGGNNGNRAVLSRQLGAAAIRCRSLSHAGNTDITTGSNDVDKDITGTGVLHIDRIDINPAKIYPVTGGDNKIIGVDRLFYQNITTVVGLADFTV